MDFSTWLQSWLKRHPPKAPPHHMAQQQYTADVMARIKADPMQQVYRVRPVRSWLSWPRLALTVATATAGALIALTVFRVTQPPQVAEAPTPPAVLAQVVAQEAELLAELEEGKADLLIENGDTLDRALETTDTLLLLAEAPASQNDEQWLEETMQLLDQLDEGASSGSEEGSDDDWLDDLQLLDETDLAASS